MFHTLTFGQYLTQLAFPPILFSAYFDSAEGAAHLSAEGRARLARFDAILQFGQGDGPSPANGHHHVVSPSGTGNTTAYANFSSHWELTSQCHCWILLFVGLFCGGSGGGGVTLALEFYQSWNLNHFCRDSNPGPFNHESCALTTEIYIYIYLLINKPVRFYFKGNWILLTMGLKQWLLTSLWDFILKVTEYYWQWA